jgi:chromate transporter
VLILAAAAIGWFVRLPASGHGGAADSFPDSASALGESIPAHAQLKGWAAMRFPVILLVLWLLPTAILAMWLGPDNRFSEIAQYFSRMAVLTFGGAYAVLAWVGQAAVEQFQWLSATEMLDGLGLAETTPGPLIMVTQYVGFLAGFREPGSLSPLAAGVAGGLLTTWVTFVPCFIWIFAGAPYVERLRANVALASSLAAITAAVVGVILNLALWFAFHYLFVVQQDFKAGPIAMTLPVLESLDPLALSLSLGAIAALFWFKLSPIKALMGCAMAGMVIKLLL